MGSSGTPSASILPTANSRESGGRAYNAVMHDQTYVRRPPDPLNGAQMFATADKTGIAAHYPSKESGHQLREQSAATEGNVPVSAHDSIAASQVIGLSLGHKADECDIRGIHNLKTSCTVLTTTAQKRAQAAQGANSVIPAQNNGSDKVACNENKNRFSGPSSIDTISNSEMESMYQSPSESASSNDTVLSTVWSRSSRSSPPAKDEEWMQRLPDVKDSKDNSLSPINDDLALPGCSSSSVQPDSPIDPLFRHGRLSPISYLDGGRKTAETVDAKIMLDTRGLHNMKESHQPVGTVPVRAATTGGSKGFCRGCSKVITTKQKSVSSVDGRLTGRYHKDCFVCHTCQNAFASADFYIYADNPYCSQHYHSLNGSLCGFCETGIEGQYLETTVSKRLGAQKFHPKCFRCVTCRVTLQEHYFELDGKAYCQRDVLQMADLLSRQRDGVSSSGEPTPHENDHEPLTTSETGLGSRKGVPERRTTRLMII